MERRLRACVETWPECWSGGYDPRCCRFPKSCSCTVYDEQYLKEGDLEMSYPESDYAQKATDRPSTPMHAVTHDLERAVSRAEKSFAILAERLQPFLQQDEPRLERPDQNAVRAMPQGSSSAVRELRDLVDRLENFGSRVDHLTDRLEL